MISSAILEKRHQLIRDVMKKRGDDIWIIAGRHAPDLKGYVRYASDWFIVDGTVFIVLPLNDDPSIVIKLGSQAYWAKKNCLIRKVYPAYEESSELVKILDNYDLKSSQIGLVGLGEASSYEQGKKIIDHISVSKRIEDVTEEMHTLLMPKNPEDFEAAEETHNILAKILIKFGEDLSVGRPEREVVAECLKEMTIHGCTDGVCKISTAKSGSNRPPQDRSFEKQDIVRVYMDAAGPQGYWVEVGGVFSFEKPSELIYRKFNTTVKAMEKAAEVMVPGNLASEVCRVQEDVFREDGWEIIDRALWDAHGQGFIKHLRPYSWPGTTDTFRENMIINAHPGIITSDGLGFSLTNNYFVTKNGGRAFGNFKHEWHLV